MQNEIKPTVTCETKSLKELFDTNLTIPPYQRIYCWNEKTVRTLLGDLKAVKKSYSLGNVILHKKGDDYEIVDGQQRLVTLTLLFWALRKTEEPPNLPLADQSFDSELANKYVAFNRGIIEQWLEKNGDALDWNHLAGKLQFNVLTLENTETLDLAYTFFSNQNARGIPLTDYELLKAHHLRFLANEAQAIHCAQRWDEVYADEDLRKKLTHTLDTILFRLRRWTMQSNWDNNQKLRIKEEFEAAPTAAMIPSFGEKFIYNESIQGGGHFFEYVHRLQGSFHEYRTLPEVDALQRIQDESHFRFREVIEALGFAYYLKFGSSYLAEALFCMERLVSEYRYRMASFRASWLWDFIGGHRLATDGFRCVPFLRVLDRATSPSFCIAAFMKEIEHLPLKPRPSGIAERYWGRVQEFYQQLAPLAKAGLVDPYLTESKETSFIFKKI